jgi:pimeloyl-ACP methyl ester carboxylesterase
MAAPLVPEGHYVELAGRGTTFVRELAGPPGAAVVALLHGWTATAALNWFPSFEPLSGHFRVLALDHRGHGRGIRNRQPFRLEDCADDLAALAAELGITRLIPVGYSMGGPIAMLTWRRHPELVQGLVLCATGGRFVGSRPTDRMFAPGMLGLSLAAALSPGVVRRRAMSRLVNNRLDGTPFSGWAADELARNDPAVLLRAGAALGAFDAREWLADVDVPTSVVMTDADRVVPPAAQLGLAHAIDGAELFTVAGDHGVCAADPASFVPALVTACRSVAERAARPRPSSVPTT